MEKKHGIWGNAVAITTKESSFTAVEFTIKIPSCYTVEGDPSKHFISMYAGPYIATDTPENARFESGIMIFPKDSPWPDSRGEMAIVNPHIEGHGKFDGTRKDGQRNLPIELFDNKNMPGQYKFKITLDASNKAHVTVNQLKFLPDEVSSSSSSSFKFGFENGKDPSNPIGLTHYPAGIKWKFDIGLGDDGQPNVSFNGAKISEIKGGKPDINGHLHWVALTGKDFDVHQPKVFPGAHFNKQDGTLEVSQTLSRGVESEKGKPVEIKLDGPTQARPMEPPNPIFNLTPLLDKKQSLQDDPIHDTALSSMMRMNAGRGIPLDPKTFNARLL